MRIVKADIPELPEHGLKRIQMEKLGQVVVLAGKNGAGKSRILQRLLAWSQERITGLGVPQSQIEGCLQANYRAPESLRPRGFGAPLAYEPFFDIGPIRPFRKNPKVVKFFRHQFPDVDWDRLYDIEVVGDGKPDVVHFVPKQVVLKDSNELSPNELHHHANQVETIGVAHLEAHALAHIQVIQSRWWNTSHQHSTAPDAQRDGAIKHYTGLNRVIKQFLGVELTRSSDGQAELFGRPIGKAALSDGQHILLQFCVAIHAQADKLAELIVLMDEPENHLHPGAMLDAITEIQKALTNGQLWIATHSVPLLAHFDPDAIWWVEDGSVQHAGSRPEMALCGLLGDDDRIGKLGDFLGLPAALAATNFAHQCLLPPGVVNTTADSQSQQIQALLAKLGTDGRLRVLDFGAGRGRLVSALREGGQTVESVRDRYDYRAFDVAAAHRTECEAAIARLYGTADQRYFTQEKDLLAALDPGSVDVVVMCNVLHEIDPEEWLPLFGEDGIIRQLLRPEGYLLIVEDLEMRMGEKAHQRGFLVLDTPQLKTFFQIKEGEQNFVVDDARKDGRLKAHLVPAGCLGKANKDTKAKALRQVKHLAKGEIKKLRNEPASYANGRKHAFHVQQLANAELALEMSGAT